MRSPPDRPGDASTCLWRCALFACGCSPWSSRAVSAIAPACRRCRRATRARHSPTRAIPISAASPRRGGRFQAGRIGADEYFMRSASANFIDMDVISVGPIVRELSAVFDRYWNSEHVPGRYKESYRSRSTGAWRRTGSANWCGTLRRSSSPPRATRSAAPRSTTSFPLVARRSNSQPRACSPTRRRKWFAVFARPRSRASRGACWRCWQALVRK